MSDPLPIQPDGVHLSSHLEPRSLWHSLHDGYLQSCVSDLLSRTIRLNIEVGHLVEEESSSTFEFLFSQVTSACASVAVWWPGGIEFPPGISRVEQCTLIHEYQAKRRMDSLSWSEFEAAFPANLLGISNASLARGAESGTLQLQGMLDGDTFHDLYCEVCIAFNGLAIQTSDHRNLSLDEFDQMGIDYWDRWQSQNSGS